MSTENSALVPAPKTQVAMSNRGITPSDMDGLWRFAAAVSKSGLAPRGIESPEAVFVALEMGLELGLPLMASLQNISIVNGRPTLWGDAQLAVVRGTGELEAIEEWFECDGKRLARNPVEFSDSTTAVCRVQRKGYAAAETGFSVADAKRAGLWGKQGPWTQYPQRMLRARARSFALRDQFGDALRGLRATEEAQDDPVSGAVNVTPIFRTTEPAPQPQPEVAPVVDVVAETISPQQALRGILEEAGIQFERMSTWATENGYKIKDAKTWDEVPESVAVRFVANKEKLLAALKN